MYSWTVNSFTFLLSLLSLWSSGFTPSPVPSFLSLTYSPVNKFNERMFALLPNYFPSPELKKEKLMNLPLNLTSIPLLWVMRRKGSDCSPICPDRKEVKQQRRKKKKIDFLLSLETKKMKEKGLTPLTIFPALIEQTRESRKDEFLIWSFFHSGWTISLIEAIHHSFHSPDQEGKTEDSLMIFSFTVFEGKSSQCSMN